MIKTSRKIRLIQVRKECGATLSAGKSNSLGDSMTTFKGTWGTFKGLGGKILEETGLLAWGWAGGTAVGDPGFILGLIAASSLASI